jgi:hypothetical protein
MLNAGLHILALHQANKATAGKSMKIKRKPFDR